MKVPSLPCESARSEPTRNHERNHPRRAPTVARPAQVFLVRAQDMDNIINVEVASEFPGGLGYNYFPSSFVLEIGYKQVRDSALNFNFNLNFGT
jgi:hypothetical protein